MAKELSSEWGVDLKRIEEILNEETEKYFNKNNMPESVRTLSGDYERDNKGRIVSQKEYDDFREAYKKRLISKEDYRNDNYDALKEIKK